MRRALVAAIIAMLVLAPLATLSPGAVADETTPPQSPEVTRQQVQESVLKGLDWFATQQRGDGSYGESVGVTGLVVLCYAGVGYDHTNRTVDRALEYIRGSYNPYEERMEVTYHTYETAITILAMTAADDPEDREIVSKLTDDLVRFQYPNNYFYNMTEDWYLGGWPNYAGLPDLSNSQFGLLGLQAALLYGDDVPVPDSVWSNNTIFTRHCQNMPDLNPMPWANDASLPSYGDGGFVYNPYRSRTPLGEDKFESYGSITAAGLYAYLVDGNDPRQPEVRAAREWLDYEYNLQVNPRMVGKGLFYYLWTQSRALAMSPQDWIVDGSGKLHDWKADTASYFIDRQFTTGGWPGNPQTGWREEEPELASMYAILSMMSGYLLVPNPKMDIQVRGADGVRFIDARGKEMATDATLGLTVTDDRFTCTDPEVFRKVWVSIDGSQGSKVTVNATGTWGDGRRSNTEQEVELGQGGANVHVAASGFAGPFGIHMVAFEDGPQLEVGESGELVLTRGETTVTGIGLAETSGRAPVTGVMLLTHAGPAIVADVGRQGITVTAGGEGSLDLTVSVDPGTDWHDDWDVVVTSSTAPPVALDVRVEDPESTGLTAVYLSIVGILVLLIIVFFLLPQVARRGGAEE